MSVTSSEDGSDSEEELHVESLVSGRERRANAGNRMATLLATEEPADAPGDEDDDLKLLFEENAEEEDAEFASGDDAVSDVEMGSSSEDEDGKEDDEEAAEKEIERQAKEEKKRKRKALEAFGTNKKRKAADVKTSASGTGKQVTIAVPPEPRPKKKIERATWLPTQDDGPIRASSRKQTVRNKQVVHERMKESEKRRKQQLKMMEAAAKRKDAEKSAPLTQEDRIAEAARVEAKNAKSLNRWEAAERRRVEEQRAKLAALKNKSLQGSVITVWSGRSEWVDGKCVSVGATSMEDKKKMDGKKGNIASVAKSKTGIKAINDPPLVAPGSASVPPAITLATGTILQAQGGQWNNLMPGNPFHMRSGNMSTSVQHDQGRFSTDTQHVVIEGRTLVALDASALKEASMQDSVLVRGRRSAIKIHGKLPEKEKCLITGLHARYRDPRTGVPYANIAAFKQLRINESAGAYTNGRWSTLLGQYVGCDADAPNAVPLVLKGGV